MGIKRHKPEEIVTKLRQVEVLCGQACRGSAMLGSRQLAQGALFYEFSIEDLCRRIIYCAPWIGSWISATGADIWRRATDTTRWPWPIPCR